MKKCLAFLVSFALVLSLSGCFNFEREAVYNEPTEIPTEIEIEEAFCETDTFLSVYKTTEMDYDVDGPTVYWYADFEKVYLSQEDGVKYPELKNALDEFNSENEMQWEESISDFRSFVSDMIEM